MTELAQLVVNGLVTGSILALAAVGVSLVYGILRTINFAHGDYLSYGAYAALAVNVGIGAGMAIATVAAIVAIAALSLAIEYGLWRPMRRRGVGVFTLFVSSLGLALVLRGVLYLVGDPRPRTYDVDAFQVYDVGGVRFSQSQAIAIAIAIVSIAFVALLFARTRIGKSMRALSDDAGLASVAGIDTDRVISITWVLSGGLAGLAGVLAALTQSSFDPNMGFVLLLPVFAAVVLGGIGSAYGALAGGLVLGLAMELSTWSGFAGGLAPTWKLVVAFVVLIAVLLVRPQGLLGLARVP